MLAAADVVFLVDSSFSADGFFTREWLDSVVEELDGTLRSAINNIDVRYGLVAFGQQDVVSAEHRAAHSQVVDVNGAGTVFQRLWSETDHLTDLQTAIGNLIVNGGVEDGWDAIDHAIAEYDFRPGAVPVFVLVQSNEGRSIFDADGQTIVQNGTLTHEGVLAALESKNVILGMK
jgi:hypothetical protein